MPMSVWTMARPRPNFGENEEITFFTLKLLIWFRISLGADDLTGDLARREGFGVMITK